MRSRVLDDRFEGWIRAGWLGFSLPALHWGGVLAAAAAALRPDDWLFPAAREARMALWRGLPLSAFLAQQLGRELPGDGRLLPAFPGAIADLERRVASIPAGPASHLPQAVGAAQAARLRKAGGAVLALCSGAAVDEPDFHVALNFAGVWRAPVVFGVRLEPEEAASFDAPARASAYGIEGAVAEGSDLAALSTSVAAALAGGKPLLLAVRRPSGDDGGLASLRRHLGNGSRPDDAALAVEAERWCDEAMEAARAAKLPAPTRLTEGVYATAPAELGEELAIALGRAPISEDS
ncbi:MAG: thiamine pyrophosphate-dependent enzyme [Myxococcales bacterium]